MLFPEVFRRISAPNWFARASKFTTVRQPCLDKPANFRPFTRPSYKPCRNLGRVRIPSSQLPLQRSFHASFNAQLRGRRNDRYNYPRIPPQNEGPYPYDPRRDPRNARPLLTPEQLRAFASSTRFWGVAALTAGGMVIFYFSNIETVPVSGRRRFNCYSKESAEVQGDLAYRQILSQELQRGRVLPRSDPRVRRVETVLARLIEAGRLGTGQSETRAGVGWEVHVIEDPNQANAFVIPGGKVFVYSGIFPVCRTNDGLAAVLGHEIAHNIAQHSAEKMSQMVLLQPVAWLLMFLDSTGMTLGLGHFLGSIVIDLGIMRVSSREQESEADHIGLMLMAEACYDPKAAIGLWQRMEKLDKETPPEWLSTHPSNKNRIQQITEILPQAESKYQEGGCTPLGGYRDAFQDAFSRTLLLS